MNGVSVINHIVADEPVARMHESRSLRKASSQETWYYYRPYATAAATPENLLLVHAH